MLLCLEQSSLTVRMIYSIKGDSNSQYQKVFRISMGDEKEGKLEAKFKITHLDSCLRPQIH